MILFLVALIVRIGVGLWLGHFAHPVPWEYENIARNLLAGNGFLYQPLDTPYRAIVLPGYPVLCAVVYALTHGSQQVLLVLQCLISAWACLQVRAIGKVVFQDRRLSRWGPWLLAIHPGLVVYATHLHSLTLDLFAFLWTIRAWLDFTRRPSWRAAALAGMASGVALLTRGTIALFLVLAAIWFIRSVSIARRRAVLLLGAAGLWTLVIVAPWLIRNAVQFHRFPLFTTVACDVFWRGNNEMATGHSYLPDGRTVQSQAPEAFRRQLEHVDELERAKLFCDDARRFIQDHPLWALKLYGKKLLSFWWFSQQTGLQYPSAFLNGYRVFYIGALACAFLGLWVTRQQWSRMEGVLLIGFMLSVGIFQSAYYVEGRHRWTVEPILLLFTGAGLGYIGQHLQPLTSRLQ